MKKLMTMMSVAIMMIAASWGLDAQTVTKGKDVSPFENVEVSKYFAVTFENNTNYHLNWEVNEDLVPYLDIYVRQNTLIVDLNKEGAKYMKRTYRGNDNAPTMKITITLPKLKALVLNENASILADSQPMYCDSFSLTAKDKVKVDNFKVSVAEGEININLSKDADVTAKMQAPKVKVMTDQSAKMALTCSAENLDINLKGSSSVGLAGDIDTLNIVSSNYSHLTVQGQGSQLSCQSKGVSEIEAEKYEVENASVVLNSAVAWINATKTIDVDLSNSAELVYCGEPALHVQSVKKASITRIENATKRMTK